MSAISAPTSHERTRASKIDDKGEREEEEIRGEETAIEAATVAPDD